MIYLNENGPFKRTWLTQKATYFSKFRSPNIEPPILYSSHKYSSQNHKLGKKKASKYIHILSIACKRAASKRSSNKHTHQHSQGQIHEALSELLHRQDTAKFTDSRFVKTMHLWSIQSVSYFHRASNIIRCWYFTHVLNHALHLREQLLHDHNVAR